MPLRVLHLSAGNLYGGVETFLTTLARERHHCPGMEPSFGVCFQGRQSDELTAAGVPVHRLGETKLSRPWTVWHARRNLARLLQRSKPDVVICHECWPQVVFGPVVRGWKLPLVFWAHGLHGDGHWLERWASLTPPNLVIANSRFTQSTLTSLFPNATCEVLYYPVSRPPAFSRAVVRSQVRMALHTDESAVVIILASRMERWKGHTFLLDALTQLRTVASWICWIAGGAQRPEEKAYRAELENRVAHEGLSNRVRFLGQRNDIPELLAAADIHCQPNIGPEPFGITFIEAMYAELAVVTTAQGGAIEILVNESGLMILPATASCLADLLKRLVRDKALREALGTSGSQRAGSLCNPPQQIDKMEKLLSKTLQQFHA